MVSRENYRQMIINQSNTYSHDKIKIIDLGKLLSNILFIIPIIQLFFIDRSNEGLDSMMYHIANLVSLVFISAFLAYFSLLRKLKFSYINYFLIAILIGLSILKTSQSDFSPYFIYLIAAFFVSKHKIEISPKVIEISILLSFLSLLFQFIQSFGRERLGNSAIDPNFSGYYFFLFFLLCWKMNFKKIGVIIISIGLMTLSRNFLLAILLFSIFSANAIQVLCRKLKILNYYLLVLISMSLLLIGGLYYLKNVKIDYRYSNSSDRLLDVKDESNQERFLINTIVVSNIYADPYNFLWGKSQSEYKAKLYKKFPHNAFLALIIGHGLLLSIVYLIFFGKIFNQNFDANIPYIFSLFAYFLFLTGGAISGVEILYYSFIFEFTRQKK